jgi:hypothetical protein
MTLPMTSCIHPVLPSKRISSLITPIIDSVWKFLPQLGMSTLTLEFEKVLFPFRASAQVVAPRGPSNEAQHKQSHETQSNSTRCYPPTHERKSGMGDREVFLLSTVPLSFLRRDQCILHCFLCPLFRKSQDETSFKGEGCNTPCYVFPNYFH